MNITVLGAGAWGTAIAIHLAKRHSVMLWDRNKKVVSETVQTRQNMTGLPRVLPCLNNHTDFPFRRCRRSWFRPGCIDDHCHVRFRFAFGFRQAER